MPSDSDGSGSRTDELSAVPDAVRHQTLAPRRNHSSGSEAVQHSGEERLHAEDPGLRAGSHRRDHLHDDALRRHALLPRAGGDLGYGLHRERGHLVRGLHHGGDDPRRRAVPRHRPHRPVEQDHRATGHAVGRVHVPAAAHGPQLRREQTALLRVQLRAALPGHTVPQRQQRAQPTQGVAGPRPVVAHAGHRPRAPHLSGRRPAASLHQRVVRRGRGQRARTGLIRPLGGRTRAHRGAVEAAHLPGGGRVLRAAPPPAPAPPARRPRAARTHHVGTAPSLT